MELGTLSNKGHTVDRVTHTHMSIFECSSGSEGVTNAETEPFPVLLSRAIYACPTVRPALRYCCAACWRDETTCAQQQLDNATDCGQRVRVQSLRTR